MYILQCQCKYTVLKSKVHVVKEQNCLTLKKQFITLLLMHHYQHKVYIIIPLISIMIITYF